MDVDFLISLCFLIFVLTTIVVILSLIDDRIYEGLKKLKKNLQSQNLIYVVFFIFIVLIFFASLTLAFSNIYRSFSNKVSPDNGLGQIGDLFNGLVAPIISLVSVLFLYRAFKAQIRANNMFYGFETRNMYREEFNDLKKYYSNLKKNGGNDISNISEDEKIDLKGIFFVLEKIKNLFNDLDDEIRQQQEPDDERKIVKIRQELFDLVNIFFKDEFNHTFRELFNEKKGNSEDIESGELKSDILIGYRELYEYLEYSDILFDNQITEFDNYIKN